MHPKLSTVYFEVYGKCLDGTKAGLAVIRVLKKAFVVTAMIFLEISKNIRFIFCGRRQRRQGERCQNEEQPIGDMRRYKWLPTDDNRRPLLLLHKVL